MSRLNSSGSSSPHTDEEVDPLNITTKDRKQFKESEVHKRKSVYDGFIGEYDVKKVKTESNGTEKDVSSLKNENDLNKDASATEREDSDVIEDEKTDKLPEEKIESEIEISKQDLKEERKVQNFRKNIKDVIDESQLDATTLVAQRLESERLARVQEQQRLIREEQRLIAAEKQANKTQLKVLSILRGDSDQAVDILEDTFAQTNSLISATTSSIKPSSKEILQTSSNDHIPESSDESSDKILLRDESNKLESNEKSKPVVVDSSSDSDDCIILSDEEEEIDEEDEYNSGEVCHCMMQYRRIPF